MPFSYPFALSVPNVAAGFRAVCVSGLRSPVDSTGVPTPDPTRSGSPACLFPFRPLLVFSPTFLRRAGIMSKTLSFRRAGVFALPVRTPVLRRVPSALLFSLRRGVRRGGRPAFLPAPPRRCHLRFSHPDLVGTEDDPTRIGRGISLSPCKTPPRRLAQLESKPCPAYDAVISNAIVAAQKFLRRIDSHWPKRKREMDL